MEAAYLSVYMATLTLFASCLLVTMVYADVQSNFCPENCINRTCPDPSTDRLACTYGCIDESKFGAVCKTPCPATCLTCYRYYRKTWECYSCKDGYYSTYAEKNCTKQCPTGCSSCASVTNCTSCENGYYQPDATLVCNACPSTCKACNSETKCSECISNFVGDTCDKCLDGKYGNNCTMDCPAGCSACSSAENCTACALGYYQTEPQSTCHTCPLQCETCYSDTNCSACKPVFNGSSCEYCIDGKYGVDCDMACPDECLTCISNDVCTSCKPDFYNGIYNGMNITNCNQTVPLCPTNCIECVNPSNCTECKIGFFNSDTNFTCSHVCPSNCVACQSDTNCTYCKDNFTGDTCDMCVDGTYGNSCTDPCPSNCSACVSGTNCTTCYDGFYNGPSPNNSTSVYNDCRFSCPDTCTKCINYTYCDACQQSFHGTACDECDIGRYGHACNETCPLNCLNNICYRNAGVCIDCPTYFTGDECNMCVLDKHGDDCNLSCPTGCLNNTCERFSANCSIGCAYPNLTGATCDTCMDGFHGYDCNSVCPLNCLNDRCNKSNGFCFHCKTNFSGSMCEACIGGKHGTNCHLNCSLTCKETECRKNDGKCLSCLTGHYGDMCNDNCSRNCKNEVCNQMTGNCLYGCESAFSGDRCCLDNKFCFSCSSNDECKVCMNGMFGKYCNETCSNNCAGDNRCHRNSGHCLGKCITGSYGNMCNETCSANCVNNSCTKLAGECVQCKPGYKGTMCNVVVASETETHSQTALLAVICGGLAAVVIICVIVFIIVFKRRKSKDETRTWLKSRIAAKDKSGVQMTDVSQSGPHESNGDTAGTIYENEGIARSMRVTTADLEGYIRQTPIEDFRKEFKMIPGGLLRSYNDSQNPENVNRNRYLGIYPYDHNRVKLQNTAPDYINASYIDGHNKQKAYIACLGPTSATMDEFRLFWQMVWQEKVQNVVILTKLVENMKMKCEQYWPDATSTMMYGDITVTNLDENVTAEYTVRTFAVSKGEESRDLSQVHFTAWPDKGTPDYVTSIVELYRRVKSLKQNSDGPVLVHCSAGVGRTGTFIALDILTEAGEEEGEVDIFNCVVSLRQQRINMVQTQDQYVYLHKALTHTLTCGNNAIHADDFQNHTAQKSEEDYQQEFDQLRATLEEMDEDEVESMNKNRDLSAFNRKGADIPGSRHRLRLYKYQTSQDNDYINAVCINSFKEKYRFIAAQTPLPSTVVDFIKLVLQEKCPCIVNLEPETLTVDSIGYYIPTENQTLTVGPFKLSSSIRRSLEAYTLRDLRIQHGGKNDTADMHVYCFQYNEWPGKSHVPPDQMNFLNFIKDVKNRASEASEEGGPILIHCLSGAIKSGLFCAVHNAIEKMENEQEVSVGNILRQILYRRQMAVPHKDQLVFCYNAVAEYLKSFNTYVNFN